MKKYDIGYTTGVFDLFHVGHLNIIRQAKAQSKKLIVGVTTDELVAYKGKHAAICFEERMAIVESIRFVDRVVPQTSMDKMAAWRNLRFNAMFVGDDWKGTPEWNAYESQFGELGVDIVYFPYTSHTSSSLLRKALETLHQRERV